MKKIAVFAAAALMLLLPAGMDAWAGEIDYQVTDAQAVHLEEAETGNFTSVTEEEFESTGDWGDMVSLLAAEGTEDTGLYKSQLSGLTLDIYNGLEDAAPCYGKESVTLNLKVTSGTASDLVTECFSDYSTAMYAYYRDHMDELYWLSANGISAGARYSSTYVYLTLTYQTSSYCTDEVDEQVNAKISEVVSGCTGTTTYEKLKYYHDWLVNTNIYDSATAKIASNDGSQAFYYAHSPIGCLINGTGVCESYAKAFKIFCMKEDIPCLLVTSSTHAWNYVKMPNGKWYMVDCTYDDPVSTTPVLRYTYFLVSNKTAVDAAHTEDSTFSYPATETSAYTVCTTHSWSAGKVVASTCQAQGYTEYTCSVCGETMKDNYTAISDHSYDAGSITKAATCTQTGVKTYTCSVCGTTKTEDIPAAGHNYVSAVTAPTCTETGYTTYTCSVCKESYKADEKAALGHSYDGGTVTKAADCISTGLKTYTCSTCGALKTEAIPVDSTKHTGNTQIRNAAAATEDAEGYTGDTYCSDCGTLLSAGSVIAKLDHVHVIVTDPAVAATCTTAGKTAGSHCSKCNQVITAQETIPALGHKYTQAVTAATCTAQGYTTYTCSVCGDTYVSDYTGALGHSYDSGKVTKAATCISAGLMTYTCSRCGSTKTETIAINASNHTGKTEIRNAAAATEDAEGYTGDTYCSDCGTLLSKGTVIAKLDHTHMVVTDEAVAATCTTAGKTAGSHCSVCGQVITAQETIPALGHSYDSGKVTKAATCVSTGLMTCTCSRCGSTKTETIALNAANHTGNTEIRNAAAATLDAAGYSGDTYCKDCGTLIAKGEATARLQLAAPVLKSAANSNGGVTVTWNAVSGSVNYRLYYRAAGESWKKAADTTGLSCKVTGLTSGKTYYFTVRCINAAGNLSYSSFNTTGLKIVYLAQPTVSLSNTSKGVTVKWTKTTGATGYIIYRKTTAAGAKWASIKKISGGSVVSYEDTTAAAGTGYYYTVRAVNGTYLSSFPTDKKILYLKMPTVTVSKLSTGVQVGWSKTTGAKGYYIYRKLAGGSWVRVKTITSGSTISWNDTTAVKGKTYYYTVRAYNGSYLSAFTSSKAVTR